ncbi:MAG: hypothetical protein VX869_04545 [Chloroflexota bacterium]|nr:hypothetical protein [Chloroflexota bacterium]
MRRKSTLIIVLVHVAISSIVFTGCGREVPTEITGPDTFLAQAAPKFHLVTEEGIVSSEDLASNGEPTFLFFAASY